MQTSVIIVNYNTQALLRQCLRSVFEKTQDIDYEIIVGGTPYKMFNARTSYWI